MGFCSSTAAQLDFALVYLSEAQHLHAALTDRKALQTWLPDFAAALAKARADLGDDAERLLSAFEADAKQKESMRTRVLLAEAAYIRRVLAKTDQRAGRIGGVAWYCAGGDP